MATAPPSARLVLLIAHPLHDHLSHLATLQQTLRWPTPPQATDVLALLSSDSKGLTPRRLAIKVAEALDDAPDKHLIVALPGPPQRPLLASYCSLIRSAYTASKHLHIHGVIVAPVDCLQLWWSLEWVHADGALQADLDGGGGRIEETHSRHEEHSIQQWTGGNRLGKLPFDMPTADPGYGFDAVDVLQPPMHASRGLASLPTGSFSNAALIIDAALLVTVDDAQQRSCQCDVALWRPCMQWLQQHSADAGRIIVIMDERSHPLFIRSGEPAAVEKYRLLIIDELARWSESLHAPVYLLSIPSATGESNAPLRLCSMLIGQIAWLHRRHLLSLLKAVVVTHALLPPWVNTQSMREFTAGQTALADPVLRSSTSQIPNYLHAYQATPSDGATLDVPEVHLPLAQGIADSDGHQRTDAHVDSLAHALIFHDVGQVMRYQAQLQSAKDAKKLYRPAPAPPALTQPSSLHTGTTDEDTAQAADDGHCSQAQSQSQQSQSQMGTSAESQSQYSQSSQSQDVRQLPSSFRPATQRRARKAPSTQEIRSSLQPHTDTSSQARKPKPGRRPRSAPVIVQELPTTVSSIFQSSSDSDGGSKPRKRRKVKLAKARSRQMEAPPPPPPPRSLFDSD
ncbi:hypothetical protein RI367_002504 [Sorochytrium milnesiophthora]